MWLIHRLRSGDNSSPCGDDSVITAQSKQMELPICSSIYVEFGSELIHGHYKDCGKKSTSESDKPKSFDPCWTINRFDRKCYVRL